MVRRRARNTTKPAAAALAVVPTNLLEEQYFASPKRKDCKMDNSPASKQAEAHYKTKSSTNSPTTTKTRTKTERTIGVPLATRSQTRTIENFFKAKTAKENDTKLAISIANNDDTDEPLQKHAYSNDLACAAFNAVTAAAAVGFEQVQLQPEFIFEISDEDEETIHTEISDEATSSGVVEPMPELDFAVHQTVSLDGSCSSRSSINATENIFLQEPVLTLNVDKTLNQASSIKINKTIEVEPVFSSPPSLGATALHGRFNQIVPLNASPTKRSIGGLLTPTAIAATTQNQLNGCFVLLPENDNSSCDSGVDGLIGSSIDNNNSNKSNVSLHSLASPYADVDKANLTPNQIVGTRRRKPATPHRILCPSPTKAAPRALVHSVGSGRITSPSAAAAAARNKKEQILSPRKSPRHFPIVATVASKSRRRLNPQQQPQQLQLQQQKDKAPYKNETTKTVVQQYGYEHQNGLISNDAETLQTYELENSQKLTASQTTTTTKQATNNTNNNKTSKTDIKQNNNNNNFLPPKTNTNGSINQKQQQKPRQQQQQITLQPLATTNNTGNRELTEFFPVRRSVRKTKTAVKEEMMRTLEQAVLEERAEGLKIAHFEGKGRGIVAERRFQRNEFVVEYIGDLISMNEAMEREKRYALDENAGCYMYYFKHKNQQYCIDATVDTGKLGRLVNHSRNGNLITKVVVVKQRPHLVLLAKDDIMPGEELTYDYGDRSKESLIHHPWLAF